MIRLFNTDDGPLAESVTEDGSQANMHIGFAISDLVHWCASRGYSLRDAETLMLSHVQMEISREILKRRRNAPP